MLPTPEPDEYLTREQVRAELAAAGLVVTLRQLRLWQDMGRIPRPIRKKPVDAMDGKARALFTRAQLGVIGDYVRSTLCPHPAERETDRLATFLLEVYPDEVGRDGRNESAVDVAIRLLRRR